MDGRSAPRPAADGASTARLAGTAVLVAVLGVALTWIPISSPLRAPLTVFFLLTAPGCAVAATLPRLDPLSRAVWACGGAVVVNLLVAQCLISSGMWSVHGGVLAISVLSVAVLLLTLLPGRLRWADRRRSGTARRDASRRGTR